MYDKLMRLPFLGWVLFVATVQLAGLVGLSQKTAPMDFVYLVDIAMRLSTIAFMLLAASTVILRSPPSGKASGLEPRISALVGTFLIYAVVLFPRRDLSLPEEIVSTVLTTIGNVGAVIALSQLGRSFSIMAESRQLVTNGPYRFVRHPLYAAEEIATIGVFLQFALLWAALLLVVQIAFQLRRMHNEELVLTAGFPEYDVYSQTTARLIPGIY
jgi:protein-S-isoprenylcysteine O-methyltransferase Ste14